MAKAVHFPMIDRAAGLYAAIMTRPDNLPAMHQHRANRDPAFFKTLACLLNGGLEKRIVCHPFEYIRPECVPDFTALSPFRRQFLMP